MGVNITELGCIHREGEIHLGGKLSLGFREGVINYLYIIFFTPKVGMLDAGSWWAHVFLAYCKLSFPPLLMAGRGALWIEPKLYKDKIN